MIDEEDWLMRPVVERMCLYESLLTGAIGLEDIDRMNDALDVRTRNRMKAQEREENRNGR
ncbi:DUF6889 family protein [Paraburkholderia dioscoreae]|jgi:hypothetical protein|uniref:Uncharacterized protein n=1 Tax=Paraburkholderia dioscoreae TaxID=2604047 RepID=A0A5Q4ZD73_9BURK|nr:hypothetical protein [Paraburkholderia dioscoreae]VVD29157.1 conserved protein of unknown function [Paraburkholderia dioscoreae]